MDEFDDMMAELGDVYISEDEQFDLIYLAGPISGLGYEGAQQKAVEASFVEARLTQDGWAVINPYSSVLHSANWEIPHEAWMEIAKAKLLTLYWTAHIAAAYRVGICLLPGWENSDGANKELAFAQELGIPVYEWMAEMTGGGDMVLWGNS